MDNFDDWSDEEVQQYLTGDDCRFLEVRKLESGEWIGLYLLAFTLSVCMDITPKSPFAYRWCFQNHNEARHFFNTAKEFDEIPEKRTSLKGHRYAQRPLLIEYDEIGLPRW